MKDCNGRELKVGDEIGFTVCSDMKTGTIVDIKDRRGKYAEYNGEVRQYAKVRLTIPEQKTIVTWDANDNPVREPVGNPITLRNVEGDYRITLLKPLDNSTE